MFTLDNNGLETKLHEGQMKEPWNFCLEKMAVMR